MDPLARSILRLSSAADISKQLDFAEVVGLPWMKSGRARSFMKRKSKERAKLLAGEDTMRLAKPDKDE